MTHSDTKLPVPEFVTKAIKDASRAVDLGLLTGYPGNSPTREHTRLYLDAQLSQHLDIRNDAIVHFQSVQPESAPPGRVHVWVERAALATRSEADLERVPAGILEDPIAHAFGTESTPAPNLAAAVKIVFAGYGVYRFVYHVTAKVQSMYDDPINPIRIFYADNYFWGDPAPGSRKYLFIVWTDAAGNLKAGVVGENLTGSIGLKLP